MFRKSYVKKQLNIDADKVIVPGTNKSKQKTRNPYTFKRTIAASLACMLVVIGSVLIITLNSNPNKPKEPDTSPKIDLQKLPRCQEVLVKHINPYSDPPSDEPNINTEDINELPVYKYTHQADKEKILYSLLNYFSIDESSYELNISNDEHEDGSSLLNCIISQNGKQQAQFSVLSDGRFMIDIEKPNENTINFGNLNPETFVSDNISIFNFNTSTVSVKKRTGGFKVSEKEPETELEKFLYYKGIGKHVIFTSYNSKTSIYYFPAEKHIGNYPICSSSKAVEKYRKGNFICYDRQTRGTIKYGLKYLDNSFDDKVLKIWLTYAIDENEYVRPVYDLLLQTKSGFKYFASVDAIDDIYLEVP